MNSGYETTDGGALVGEPFLVFVVDIYCHGSRHASAKHRSARAALHFVDFVGQRFHRGVPGPRVRVALGQV